MSAWSKVGGWLKDNSGGLVGLAGAVLTGNVPAGAAIVASMVSEATGEHDPDKALEKLKAQDPAIMFKLEELAVANEQSIREHHLTIMKLEFEDAQKEHAEQQTTIRAGDVAEDEYVRRTRPLVARQSWYATMGYVISMELLHGLNQVSIGASWEMASILVAPCAAYLGFRTLDKFKAGKK